MSDDHSEEFAALQTAELMNAPNSGLAAFALERLRVAEENIGQVLANLSLRESLEILGLTLAETAAQEALAFRAIERDVASGETRAELYALLNEALGATSRAYGVLSDAYEKIKSEP